MVLVPNDKELGRVCRTDLLILIAALRDERDRLAAELDAVVSMHPVSCDCPNCAVGAGPW